jgi:hypothetical protein
MFPAAVSSYEEVLYREHFGISNTRRPNKRGTWVLMENGATRLLASDTMLRVMDAHFDADGPTRRND